MTLPHLICLMLIVSKSYIHNPVIRSLTPHSGYQSLHKFVREGSSVTMILDRFNPFACTLNGSRPNVNLSFKVPGVFNDIATRTLLIEEAHRMLHSNSLGQNKSSRNKRENTYWPGWAFKDKMDAWEGLGLSRVSNYYAFSKK